MIAAKNFELVNSKIFAKNNKLPTLVIKLGSYEQNQAAKIFGATINGNETYVNNNEVTNSLDTANAGIDAPSYTVAENVFYNWKVNLKENDVFINNKELTE